MEELGDQEWIVGNFDNATQAYREELRVDPLSVTAKYKLGSILLKQQDLPEGVQLLREVLHRRPFAERCALLPGQRVGEHEPGPGCDPRI